MLQVADYRARMEAEQRRASELQASAHRLQSELTRAEIENQVGQAACRLPCIMGCQAQCSISGQPKLPAGAVISGFTYCKPAANYKGVSQRRLRSNCLAKTAFMCCLLQADHKGVL